MLGDVLVGVRAFRQRGDDQIVTLFGRRRPPTRSRAPAITALASAGDFDAVGWGVSVTRSVGDVDPRLGGLLAGGRASGSGNRATCWRAGARRQPGRCGVRSRARPHGDLESVVPASSTRVFVLYKLNTAVAADGIEQASAGGPRFDVQINQALPFRFAGRGGKRSSR